MKNANIFVDVDLTLVDANGRLLENAEGGQAEGLPPVPVVHLRRGVLP